MFNTHANTLGSSALVMTCPSTDGSNGVVSVSLNADNYWFPVEGTANVVKRD